MMSIVNEDDAKKAYSMLGFDFTPSPSGAVKVKRDTFSSYGEEHVPRAKGLEAPLLWDGV